MSGRRAYLVRLAAGAVGVALSLPSTGTDTPARAPGDEPPYWAFAVNPEAGPESAASGVKDEQLRHVPGSARAFKPAELSDLFSAPDWHPDGHPPMPAIVASGRKPEVFACGYCHLPNGQGRPENSSLAGLPASYILGQVADFKAGLRGSSEPRHLPTAYMAGAETKAGEAELEAAAGYFAALKPRPWIRVLESDTVPRTRVAGWMLVPADAGGTEPIGARILEMAVDLERTELRDDASGFLAYVPTGSIGTGAELVASGRGGRTVPCAGCHGEGLRGLGAAPRLAGRSPSYIVRQLYDFKHGARHGAGAALMQAPVAALTLTDMLSIAAYAASLEP